MVNESFETFEKLINVKFKSKILLKQALTHKSYAIETGGKNYNERLEFLGDSVLALVVANYLYKSFPNENEGYLSKIKSQWVSRQALVAFAKTLSLGKYILMSSGEESTGGRERESILANAFEAVIGAVFLDAGFSPAQKFVIRFIAKQEHKFEADHKSRLQEIIQKQYKTTPEYRLLEESGPDHSKIFKMEVKIKRKLLGRGEGRSKKEAEQKAAEAALKKLKV